ncbi:MAG: gamma-glutamylcyclotransferase family protein [bacterium]
MTIHYLAYGSNLHPLRLRERIASAELLGAVAVPGHRLAFHKRSPDGSGKCGLVAAEDASANGALYRIARAHKDDLDRIEGVGDGYECRAIVVQHQSCEYDCFTYFAQAAHIADDLPPYDWYKALVVRGAAYLGFPAAYVAAIEQVKAAKDHDATRRDKNYALLQRIADHD